MSKTDFQLAFHVGAHRHHLQDHWSTVWNNCGQFFQILELPCVPWVLPWRLKWILNLWKTLISKGKIRRCRYGSMISTWYYNRRGTKHLTLTAAQTISVNSSGVSPSSWQTIDFFWKGVDAAVVVDCHMLSMLNASDERNRTECSRFILLDQLFWFMLQVTNHTQCSLMVKGVTWVIHPLLVALEKETETQERLIIHR